MRPFLITVEEGERIQPCSASLRKVQSLRFGRFAPCEFSTFDYNVNGFAVSNSVHLHGCEHLQTREPIILSVG